MAKPTRDERLAAQDRDAGEPSDQVHVIRSKKVYFYHDDADCRTLIGANEVRTMTRQAA